MRPANDNEKSGWGSVPTTNGSISSSIPAPGSTTSPTQDAQAATAATQAVVQAKLIPAPPVAAPIDQVGNMVSLEWATWFQKIKFGQAATSDDSSIMGSYDSQQPNRPPAGEEPFGHDECQGQLACLRDKVDFYAQMIDMGPTRAPDSARLGGQPPSFYLASGSGFGGLDCGDSGSTTGAAGFNMGASA